LAARFSLEVIFDGRTGVGTAEGTWQLIEPPDPDRVARGELIGVVTSDPPSEAEPPDPDLELHGLLIGLIEPPDPDMPAQRLIGNFTASLADGARNFTGAVGDPSIGDPSTGELLPAILIASDAC
jgi:hypothetical protein